MFSKNALTKLCFHPERVLSLWNKGNCVSVLQGTRRQSTADNSLGTRSTSLFLAPGTQTGHILCALEEPHSYAGEVGGTGQAKIPQTSPTSLSRFFFLDSEFFWLL